MRLSRFPALLGLLGFALGAAPAHAVLVTVAGNTCGTAQRVASLSASVTCSYEANGVTGTPSAANLNGYFGADAPWSAAGSVAGANGSGGYLTIALNPGNTWGSGPLSGTWQIDPVFWATYDSAIISMHVGNGQGNPDWFFWQLVDGDLSGTFSYERLTGAGGGLSNLFLWGAGTATVPEPGGLALLGAGLLGLGLARRRRTRTTA